MIAVLPPAKPTRPDLVKLDRRGTPAPGANVLREGFLTPVPSVPEDAATVDEQARAFFNTLAPRNDFQAWLVDDVALVTLRLERVARIERRERDRIALRAEFFWDDDRRAEVEVVGRRLADDPAATVRALARTPHGCEWMIERWAMLARVADLEGRWDEAQTALAFDLLGTPHALRVGTPGQAVDAQGRPAGEAGITPAALARAQAERLLIARDRAVDADALDRALAMADMADASSPELRRLRRYESTLHKRLRWNLHQLQQVPKFAGPHPSLVRRQFGAADEPPKPPTADASPAPGPDAVPSPPDPVESEAAGAVAIEVPAVTPPPTKPSRPDPTRALAEARRQARDRKKAGRDPG